MPPVRAGRISSALCKCNAQESALWNQCDVITHELPDASCTTGINSTIGTTSRSRNRGRSREPAAAREPASWSIEMGVHDMEYGRGTGSDALAAKDAAAQKALEELKKAFSSRKKPRPCAGRTVVSLFEILEAIAHSAAIDVVQRSIKLAPQVREQPPQYIHRSPHAHSRTTMSDTATVRRQLKIKAGVCKRLYKEHKLYQKEEEDQKRKLDKFIADAAEDWDIKNARRMLEESQKMITDTANRLGGAVQDLRELLVAGEKDPALKNDEVLMQAQETFEEASRIALQASRSTRSSCSPLPSLLYSPFADGIPTPRDGGTNPGGGALIAEGAIRD
ncbi:hypothetical protein IEO21_03225 [Rhodonia placenta]|uniref:DRBM domain-containing protein n=1 Tax=Rhodonia placenta TaxID=104341 RepID=A0A8H7U4E8_9APHY|nr:hypothetical protein IEO21_03225 [Postia placenta]